MLSSPFTAFCRCLLILCVLASSLPGLAQSDPAARQRGYILAVDPLPAVLGEIPFSYERHLSKRWGVEYTLGYVYRDLYWYDYNEINKGSLQFLPASGVAVRVFTPRYTGPEWGKGFYAGPLVGYRFVHMPGVRKEYSQYGDLEMYSDGGEIDYEDKICDYCVSRERFNKHVVSLQFLIGTKRSLGSRLVLDTYFGLGVRAKMINARIFELYDRNTGFNFVFDNYRYQYFVFLPTAHFGIKAGLRSKP
jgi:hypothetical protein